MSRLSSLSAVLLLLLASCTREPPRPPNVLLIVIDTLRADKLGAYGNERGLTPFLDSLTRRGAVFERAYAASSWTVPSMASLFTSRFPSQHGVVTFGQRIRRREVTLGDRLGGVGWLAGGFVANPNLVARFGLSHGFDYWWDHVPEKGKLRGDVLRAEALRWLDQAWQPRGRVPAFLYVHYMAPHEPYDPPADFRRRFALGDDGRPLDAATALRNGVARTAAASHLFENGAPLDMRAALDAIVAGKIHVRHGDAVELERLYDAEVASADDQVRRLIEALEGRGFLRNAVVVVTADHGEEFFEHGWYSHGRTLYEESVRVPLIVLGPGVAAGERIAEPVSLVDVAPTILDLVALPAEPRFEGRSLTPLIRSDARAAFPPADVVLELKRSLQGRLDKRAHRRGIVRGNEKALEARDRRIVVYDLAADPGETRPEPSALAGRAPLVDSLRQLEDRFAGGPPPPSSPPPVDDDMKRRLRALGYHF